MATLRINLMPVVDAGRQLVADLGLRTATVRILSRSWSGGEIRLGDDSDAAVTITPPPRVRESTGGGLVLDKITPAFPGGGYEPVDLVPPDTSSVEYLYEVTQADGIAKLYTAGRLEIDRNFGYRVTLNPTLYRAEP